MKLKLKVCGLRDPGNIREIAALNPDFMGFIFYPPSPRYVSTSEDFPFNELSEICTTGVFVNEELPVIVEIIKKFSLKAVQLHGSESLDMCEKLGQHGVKVLKTISIAERKDFLKIDNYSGLVDYIVLDTKTITLGGSGQKFDWQLLENYKSPIPFLLGGGVDEDDALAICSINNPMLAGLDINSRFEFAPGIKDADKINRFYKELTSILN